MKILQKTSSRELLVVEKNGRFYGTLNDGDIRRAIIKNAKFSESIEKFCNINPVFVFENYQNISNLKERMLQDKIYNIPVVDKHKKIKDYITLEKLLNKFKSKKKAYKISAVIMAGGEGKRLKPFSDILPKPLLPINNSTIIEEIINQFYKHDINQISISVNYKANILKTFLSKKKYLRNIKYINENKPLGTVGSLSLLKKNFADNFFVTNCDTLIDYDYSNIIDNHIKSKSILTTILAKKKLKLNYGICKKNKKNELIRINEKPEKLILVNTGMYLMNNDILKYIPKKRKFDITDLINLLINKKIKINTYAINDVFWTDVGEWSPFSKFISKFSNI